LPAEKWRGVSHRKMNQGERNKGKGRICGRIMATTGAHSLFGVIHQTHGRRREGDWRHLGVRRRVKYPEYGKSEKRVGERRGGHAIRREDRAQDPGFVLRRGGELAVEKGKP